jgi:hypothetical protein
LEFAVDGFWDYVVELSALSEDSDIYYIEMAETGDFFQKYGTWPIIELARDMSQRDYISALNVPLASLARRRPHQRLPVHMCTFQPH